MFDDKFFSPPFRRGFEWARNSQKRRGWKKKMKENGLSSPTESFELYFVIVLQSSIIWHSMIFFLTLLACISIGMEMCFFLIGFWPYEKLRKMKRKEPWRGFVKNWKKIRQIQFWQLCSYCNKLFSIKFLDELVM